MKPKRSFYERHEALILGGAAVVLTLAVWQALWSAGKISPLFMSGPSAIAKQFMYGLQHGTLLSDLAYSGTNFAVGFALALVAGVVAGRHHRLVSQRSADLRSVSERTVCDAAHRHGAADHHLVRHRACGRKCLSFSSSAFFPILVNTVAGVQKHRPGPAARGARLLRVGLADFHHAGASRIGAVHPDRRPPGSGAGIDRRGGGRDVRRTAEGSASWWPTADKPSLPIRCSWAC